MPLNVFDYFQNESAYPDLDADAAARRLSAALQCNTTGYLDTSLVDYGEFDRLHRLMLENYPHVAAEAEFREIGHSVLFTLKGSDPSLRPALFMSHQDVVPVVPGTEVDWLHGPFSGDIADGFIWGRGALDIKEMVFGILEAGEYLLAHKVRFARTIYFAFGQDEETLNTGAKAIADFLESQGVQLEFLLDEGGGRIDTAAAYGAPGAVAANICLGEKGYLDLALSVKSSGGHSSNPWGGTSLGALARAIDRIQSNPLPPKMTPVLREAFSVLAPRITEEPFASLSQNPAKYEAELTERCMERRGLYNLISTTIAPTMIEGGSQAGNVMPQDMRAVINFRIAPHNTVDEVISHCRSLADERVEISVVQGNEASALARTDGYGYPALTDALRRFFTGVVFLPAISAGATDAHQYENICDTCLRFSPFLEQAEIVAAGVHGTNERISVRSYAQGIRVLISLMEATCAEK